MVCDDWNTMEAKLGPVDDVDSDGGNGEQVVRKAWENLVVSIERARKIMIDFGFNSGSGGGNRLVTNGMAQTQIKMVVVK